MGPGPKRKIMNQESSPGGLCSGVAIPLLTARTSRLCSHQ